MRGDRCLFRDVSFTLDSGELLVVEGENGSGKTSLLRAIAGTLDFESGEVHWRDKPVLQHYQEFRAAMAWLSHKPGCKADLTLMENLRFESGLRATEQDRLPATLDRLGLNRLTDLPFRSLSAGQQRRVSLARMVLAVAPLWVMDEPFTNLDKAGQRLVVEVIREHLGQGGLCVVATHQDLDIDGPVKRVTIQ